MRERKRKVEHAKKIRGTVHEKDKSKASRRVQDEMERLTQHDEQECVGRMALGWQQWRMALGFPRCVPKQDGKKWSTFAATRCTQEPPGSCACARLEEHPSRQDGRRLTDKGQPGKPNIRARWVAALKVVLSEIATGKRKGKVVALVDVRRAYFYAPARRRVLVELPREDCQTGDEYMCGLLQHSLYGTRDAAQNWEEELASTLCDLKLTRGVACPCVRRGHIEDEHVVATVHGDDTTDGGERSAVELLIGKISRKYEIKKQRLEKMQTLTRVGEH